MKNLIIIPFLLLNCGLLFGQNSFKKLILYADPANRSQSFVQSIFLENNHLIANKETSGRSVYVQRILEYSLTGDYVQLIKHPPDSLIPYAVPEEYEYGPWKSGKNFLASYSYSTGANRYFFSVKYTPNGTSLWKVDTLKIYDSDFSEKFGDFIIGTKDYNFSKTIYHQIDNTGNPRWIKNFADSTIIKSVKKKGVCVYQNFAFLFFTNGKDSSQILQIDTNGTILKSTLFKNLNLVDIKSKDSNLLFVESDSTLHISKRRLDYSEITRYTYQDTFSLNYQNIISTSKGFLIHSTFKTDPNKFGTSQIPELRLIDDNFNYKFRRYYRINVFDTIKANDDVNFYLGIHTYQEDSSSGYRIFFQVGGQKPGYKPFSKYYLLKTDSNLNVNDSIELNGQVQLFQFDSVLTPLTQHNPTSYILENRIQNLITIYPNPATSFLHIKTKDKLKSEYRILTLSGKSLIAGKLDNSNYIDVSSLSTGHYLLELNTSQGIIRKKIIIEKE